MNLKCALIDLTGCLKPFILQAIRFPTHRCERDEDMLFTQLNPRSKTIYAKRISALMCEMCDVCVFILSALVMHRVSRNCRICFL